MRLTQEEARKWAEILKGFSEGKRYQIPYVYNAYGEVVEYWEITDFKVNPNYPTIQVFYGKLATELIRPDDVMEIKEIEKQYRPFKDCDNGCNWEK